MKHIELSAREARFIRANVPLAHYTTFKIGGNAEYLAEVRDTDELREACVFARTHGLAVLVLGGGSNLLIHDEGFQGLVIHMEIRGIVYDVHEGNVMVTVGAGEELDEVIRAAVENNLWGIENLSAIPGSIGGAAVQNAGAYGVELSGAVDSVMMYDTHEERMCVRSYEECAYGYRESLFKREAGKHLIITHVTLALSRASAPQLSYKDLASIFPEGKASLKEIRAAVANIRAAKFPDLKQYGTAGSFFKNPVISKEKYAQLQETYPLLPGYTQGNDMIKIPIAWILDNVLALRGVREGDVGAWEAQPLVITNYGEASAYDVNMFVEKIISDVRIHTGIVLEREVITV